METMEVDTDGPIDDLKLLCKPSNPEQSPTLLPLSPQGLGKSQGMQCGGVESSPA